MIKLHTQNLQEIDKNHGVSENELKTKDSQIKEYLEKIHQRNQGFYEILDDEATINKIKDFTKKVEGKYENIVILGIGGSALGAICLKQSLKHLYEDSLETNFPKLHILDNIDPVLLKETEDILELEKTLFLVITKSGGTPETLSQFFYFREKVLKENLNLNEHFVFITDPEKGLLREVAKEEKIPTFEIPQNVGGRFSVLTPVGLLPASLIGINIEKLIEGAKKMRTRFLSENFENNLAFQLAKLQFELEKKGKTINVLLPYSQKLIKFADWYRQLLAESIGKKSNNKGKEVNVGITPINALGATDQHSQNQLYNEGPNDKLFILIKVNQQGPELKIKNPYPDNPIVDYIKDLSFNKLIHTEMEGTIQSFNQNDRPNITIEINEVNEETIGQLFMLFEGSIAILGELFEINAFDQPGVELSKTLTKQLLLK